MEEGEKQMSTNECVIRKVGSAIKDQRKGSEVRGRSCFLKREQVVAFLKGLAPFQMGTERCLEYNKPGGARHGHRQK